jgi:hypothetical protein
MSPTTRIGLAAAALAATGALVLGACGADDREMQRPDPDQTTTSLVRGTTTTIAGLPVVTVTTTSTTAPASTTTALP